MSSECQGQSSWPGLLGADGRAAAAATVERENPYVHAEIVLEGSTVTGDFLCTRLRIWVNDQVTVTKGRVHCQSWWEPVDVQLQRSLRMRTPKSRPPLLKKAIKLVSSDFRCDRVRLWVDVKGLVTRVPVIG